LKPPPSEAPTDEDIIKAIEYLDEAPISEAPNNAHNTYSAALVPVIIDNETVPASYVPGSNKQYKVLPKRPRYLTLSDSQVLDRANQPCADMLSGKMIQDMKRANDSAYGFIPVNKPLPKAVKDKVKTPRSTTMRRNVVNI